MTTRRRLSLMPPAAAALVTLAAGATPALAQFSAAPAGPSTAQSTARPPRVEPPEPARSWLAYAVAIVVGGMVVGIAIIPSQRTHQD